VLLKQAKEVSLLSIFLKRQEPCCFKIIMCSREGTFLWFQLLISFA
jgi:hypothetical protein